MTRLSTLICASLALLVLSLQPQNELVTATGVVLAADVTAGEPKAKLNLKPSNGQLLEDDEGRNAVYSSEDENDAEQLLDSTFRRLSRTRHGWLKRHGPVLEQAAPLTGVVLWGLVILALLKYLYPTVTSTDTPAAETPEEELGRDSTSVANHRRFGTNGILLVKVDELKTDTMNSMMLEARREKDKAMVQNKRLKNAALASAIVLAAYIAYQYLNSSPDPAELAESSQTSSPGLGTENPTGVSLDDSPEAPKAAGTAGDA
ncbi:UNVERIFIED_CONTAM: hypothetical protein HHA_451480 [Hammondia hammondi]|eukprot:XP_008884301.1 hypothetical protein HHA_451480 [Hammondia hammondi]